MSRVSDRCKTNEKSDSSNECEDVLKEYVGNKKDGSRALYETAVHIGSFPVREGHGRSGTLGMQMLMRCSIGKKTFSGF